MNMLQEAHGTLAGFSRPIQREDSPRCDLLESLGLANIAGVKAFRGELVKDHRGRRDITSVKRSLRAAMGGRASEKHSTSLSEVKRYFAKAGFKFVKDFARTPLIHTLHVAVFERDAKAKVAA